MAVDKPGDYYNSPTNYTDNDGNMKTFTYIDCDKKPTMSTMVKLEEDELATLKSQVKQDRLQRIEQILSYSASLCPFPFQDFTLRGENQSVIEWNETMLRDEGLPPQRIIDLLTLMKNSIRLRKEGLID